MSRPLASPVRIALVVAVVAAGVVTIVASGGGGGGSTPPPATTGSLTVNVGFGAVSSPPYQCTGAVTITVTPVSLSGTAGTTTAQTRNVTFSGTSSTTPNAPACQRTEAFGNLSPGSWNVSNGVVTCPTTIVAGQNAEVRIWNNACS